MAIGLGTAILGSALIGGAASAVGGATQASAATNAANAQVSAANYATDVQAEIARENAARLEPFRQLGTAAINPLADLLGLDYQYSSAPEGPSRTVPGQNAFNQYGAANYGNAGRFASRTDGANYRYYDNTGRIPQNTAPQQGGQNASAAATVPIEQRTTNAFETLMNRPGYEFRFNEGNRALDASAASRGMIGSGSNIKAAIRYGQDYGSNEYTNEINRLLAVMGGGQVATNQTNAGQAAFAQQAGNNAQAAGNARASGYVNRGNAISGAINGVTNNFLTGAGAYGQSQGWF